MVFLINDKILNNACLLYDRFRLDLFQFSLTSLATQLCSQTFTRGKAVNRYYAGVVTKVETLPILKYRH